MAWEDRNGRLYYYRKRREGKRVVSEYVGNGFAGMMAEELDGEDRQKAEQKRRELTQAAAPGLELVRRVRRHIRSVLESDGIERFVIGVDAAGIFAATATGEHDLDLLPEACRAVDVIRVDDSAAEESDVRKLVEVLQRDEFGLHSAH